ncbi:ribosomal protein S18 acetylase RimI-like enzyme [Roseiarcus fermentans]|uniref:Ribosomal protein S18 acetylase RimI-like enzyme n=1 Tax=Roseiarcus fermentans TaxID=1473586 RepID=A0A366FUK1_9HYPH|nr:GNAT family N-acetyltransferase [Roseiarcus fermentans]RBP18191.1 ribosomal protein S18 acetylase RimI-like enzyme [Roseiarcus fermentans]
MSPWLHIRPATVADRPNLRRAVVELQDHESRLHDSRLPGEQVADAYLARIETRAARDGVMLVAESAGAFVGFVAGWIEQSDAIIETPDSDRFAFVSDIFVAPAFRGRRVAAELLAAIERRLARPGITRLRLCALAANDAATRAYLGDGFSPYEVVYERPVARRTETSDDRPEPAP